MVKVRLSLCEDRKGNHSFPDNLNTKYDYDDKSFIFPAYGLGLNQRVKDLKLTNELYTQSIFVLKNVLNKHHKTAFTQKDWEILIGHFLIRTIRVFINRSNGLQKILLENEIEEIEIKKEKLQILASSNSYGAIWKFSNSQWNEQIYRLLIKKNKLSSLITKENNKILNEQNKQINKNKDIRFNMKKIINIFMSSLRIFQKSNNVMISKSYASLWERTYISLLLKQIPQLYHEKYEPVNSDYDKKLRLNLINKLSKDINNDLRLLLELCIFSLPKCYLEDYGALISQTHSVNWPTSPVAIVTGNDFDSNDLFKMWTVLKRKMGSTYIVIQHGASYGTNILSKPSIEEKTCDKFITWGWEGSSDKYIKGGMQLSKYKKKKTSKQNKILLIQRAPFQKVQTYDVNAEFYRIYSDQKYFISALNTDIKNNLNVRLQSDWKYHNFKDYDRWVTLLGCNSIDIGNFKLSSQYKKYELLIFTYESTGFLQSLAGNSPVVGVWDNIIEFASSEVKDYYFKLLEVGILHNSYTELAKFLNETNIQNWWLSQEVQSARRKFVESFCNQRTLSSILVSQLQ